MLKKIPTTLKPLVAAGAFALVSFTSAAPVAAQDDVSEDMRALELMGSMFGTPQPLTAEQESRLPVAQLVVGQIFPEGTYAKMMEETMKPMMDGIMDTMMGMPASELVKLTGLPYDQVDLQSEGTIGEAMAIMDPDYQARAKIGTDMTVAMVTDLMTEIEPSYRAGLARAYAVRFSELELAELSAFFKTPTGAHYAAESMLIYTDPQVMSAMNEMMPAMMEMMPIMIGGMEEAMAGLREPRKYSALSRTEKLQLAQILGVSPAALADAEPADDAEAEEF
ncbi:hypothetical protein GCM10023115_03060 [Pontixanthobacter gangjinensis]|uniref:DUF2059 domain-containing protein n=1 Tax=Pontixanthobacter gangjinensis TaxID=1028742 RepID=A0A6I4SIN7_9SPHN|nr:DUF2059 domain-containing protein [Pontixanthobacter gangjinensis]MXO55559.1 DUF2059 domain-containing protein [Pontixanthobacter gangjinensis]